MRLFQGPEPREKRPFYAGKFAVLIIKVISWGRRLYQNLTLTDEFAGGSRHGLLTF